MENSINSVLLKKLQMDHNIILRGAPGTGKTYMAHRLAADMIGISVEELINTEQFAFVQFHPSYDYTDFVEGLRPVYSNGQIGFELKDGIFKEFCHKARIADEAKAADTPEKKEPAAFTQEGFEKYLNETSPKAASTYIRYIRQLLGQQDAGVSKISELPTYKSLQDILNDKDKIIEFDAKHKFSRWLSTPIRYLEIYYKAANQAEPEKEDVKNYVILIDEINRGEVSKIFGELFFSIDPDYRGPAGAVFTQYANLHKDPSEKFYVPENVYIIGTMNDIDRSVDTFDFAMRRRFSFIEITAADSQIMLENKDVKNRMSRLNEAIIDPEIGALSRDYQIGGSYFLGLDHGTISIDDLWKEKLEPLLADYYKGESDENAKLQQLRDVYYMASQDENNAQ